MADQNDFTEPLSRRKREKARHRREIMDIAITVFSEKGYHAATLDEIAQKAEFSKGALYLYFQNKEDILFMILKESLEQHNIRVREIVSGNQSFREELRALFYHTAEDLFREPGLFALITTERVSLYKAMSQENRNELLMLSNQLWTHLEKRIAQAIERKEIRDFGVEAMIGLIRGATSSMIYDRWNSNTIEELKSGIDLFIDMIFNGIVYRKTERE